MAIYVDVIPGGLGNIGIFRQTKESQPQILPLESFVKIESEQNHFVHQETRRGNATLNSVVIYGNPNEFNHM